MSYRLDIRNQKKGTYLVIEEKYRDKETKKPTTKLYKTLGYVHDLQKEFPDPIAHFKDAVAQMNADNKGKRKITLEIDLNEKLRNESQCFS